MPVDLHIHTNASDGLFTPELVIEEALKANLDAVSVTDHDSVDNVPQLLSLAQKVNLKVLPGVELSTVWKEEDVHFLGYYIDPANPELLSSLAFLREARVARMQQIVDKFNENGFGVTLEEILAATHGGAAGRSHLARVLLKKRYVSSINEAFEKYLGRGKPFFVEKKMYEVEEAIDLIKKAGGAVFLAHPAVSRVDDDIDLFISWGLDGLEAYYPEHTLEEQEHYIRLAQEKGLMVSGGSDAHGFKGRGEHLGEFTAPTSAVQKLLEWGNKASSQAFS
jgi:hypothetical protein